jgi:hypothetical protein
MVSDILIVAEHMKGAVGEWVTRRKYLTFSRV